VRSGGTCLASPSKFSPRDALIQRMGIPTVYDVPFIDSRIPGPILHPRSHPHVLPLEVVTEEGVTTTVRQQRAAGASNYERQL